MELLAYDRKLKNSVLGRMETRLKIVSIFTLVALLSSLENLLLLASAAVVMFSVVLLTGVSPASISRRFLWLLPFVGFMLLFFPFITPGETLFTLHLVFLRLSATGPGLEKALFLGLRVLNAMLAISLLVLTTPATQLFHGFRRLRVPGIMVNMAAFTLRYFQVLGEEVKQMQFAMRARDFRQGRSLLHRHTMKTLGLLVGNLFIRSYERGERIYIAMLSRGYQGEPVCCGHCSPKTGDWLTGFAFVGFATVLKFVEWRGLGIWL
ncbi:MAG: cobalt ECF transporter T component CbiQ [Bacillota bacterium]